jgi:integrase
MAPKKISISTVKELEPDQTIWDSEMKGFGCRRRQNVKVFILKYRFGKGRSARQYLYTIGRLGSPWTPEMARDEAKRILGRIANGENPAAERQHQKKANSVNEAFDLFMADGKGKRGPRTLTEYRRLYDKLAKKEIGRHRVQDVIRADITKLHSNLAGTAPQANRLLQMLSAFFTWCEKQQYRPEGSNPCRHVDKYKEKSRERFLSERELFALSQSLIWYERHYGHLKEMPHKKIKIGNKAKNTATPYVTAAIRLLIFTGARRNEILTLEWSDVDFQNKQIRLQESKTGRKSIQLSAPALQILSSIPRIDGNPYVIAGAKERSHLVNIKDPWQRIRQNATIALWQEDHQLAALIGEERTKLPEGHRIGDLFTAIQMRATKEKINLPTGLMDVRLHDQRHNFASTAVTIGHHLKVVGSLLGHARTATTERYAHLANDPLQTASEAISQRLLDAMTAQTNKKNVVQIK